MSQCTCGENDFSMIKVMGRTTLTFIARLSRIEFNFNKYFIILKNAKFPHLILNIHSKQIYVSILRLIILT